MKDILSEIDNTQNKPSTIFSRLAFGCAILTVVLFAILVKLNFRVQHETRESAMIHAVVAVIILFSMLAGFICSIVSLVRREKIKFIKVMAAVINFGIISLMLIGLLYSALMYFEKQT